MAATAITNATVITTTNTSSSKQHHRCKHTSHSQRSQPRLFSEPRLCKTLGCLRSVPSGRPASGWPSGRGGSPAATVGRAVPPKRMREGDSIWGSIDDEFHDALTVLGVGDEGDAEEKNTAKVLAENQR